MAFRYLVPKYQNTRCTPSYLLQRIWKLWKHSVEKLIIFNSETSNNSIAVSNNNNNNNNNNVCSNQLDLKPFKHNIPLSKLKILTPAGMQ